VDNEPVTQQIADKRSVDTLRVTEIFLSLQGESRTVGLPTVFVRLTGCPLRCQYCDTAYAFSGGEWLSLDDILATVKQHQTPWVTVTGGEPLAQKQCLTLLTRLCDAGFEVSLETSGALPVDDVDPRVVKVMDIKTPGSKESSRNRLDNLTYIQHKDQIKFVICDEQDYQWSRDLIRSYDLTDKCEVLMSPSYGHMESAELAGWILRDHLPVRFQLQLHKILWGDEPGR
jgi:7-carboxy-7-deazaguanine synthase